MKFHEFVSGQVERLGAIAEFVAKVNESGRTEITTWLISRADSWPEKHNTWSGPTEWVREFAPAAKIKSVIDECVGFSIPPGLSDIKAVWFRLCPPASPHEKCEICGGTGWVIVARSGNEGAQRCGGAKK